MYYDTKCMYLLVCSISACMQYVYSGGCVLVHACTIGRGQVQLHSFCPSIRCDIAGTWELHEWNSNNV